MNKCHYCEKEATHVDDAYPDPANTSPGRAAYKTIYLCGLHAAQTERDAGNTSRVRRIPCRSHKDGDCFWEECPQLRDDEPKKTGRSCPLFDWGNDGYE